MHLRVQPVLATEQELREFEDRFWQKNTHRFGGWEFRIPTGDVLVDGGVVARLSETEAETLNMIINAYPMPVNVAGIIQKASGMGVYYSRDTVKVVVRRIRKKLGDEIVETSPRGYTFNPRAAMTIHIVG